MALISLEIYDMLTDCDEGYIDIRFAVINASIIEMAISLKK